jgi:hypothetical protein
MNKMTGGFYRFRSGFRVVTSEPVSYEGQMCVQVAQAYIRFTEPMTVRVNEDGTAYAYPGRAYLPLSLLSHEMEMIGPVVHDHTGSFRAFQPKLIKVVPKRKRNKKRRTRK